MLRTVDVPADSRAAFGSHGQTLCLDPQTVGSSLQLGEPNRIAALTGICTIADFRRADMARSGQGAPLVPAFHHAVFADAQQPRIVLNIGGIAHVTILPNERSDAVTGVATGPGKAYRKSVEEGKSVSVRVDLGGRRVINNKTTPRKTKT